MTNQYSKYIELFIITIVFPLIIIIYNLQKYVIPIVIFSAFLSIYYLHKKKYKFNFLKQFDKKQVIKIIIRDIIICVFIYFLIFINDFPILPINDFKLFLIIIIIYPIISVLPQEICFRAFFFHRYSILFHNKILLVVINGLIFGLLHSIYLNLQIIIITFLAGILFSLNYYYNKSLLLVTIEHSLLGNFIFSIGLCYYFHESIIWKVYSIL